MLLIKTQTRGKRALNNCSSMNLAAVFVFLALLVLAQHAFATSLEIVKNGGFETGDFTAWSEPTENPNPWSVVPENPFTGNFSAFNPAKDTAIGATTLFQSFAPTPVDKIVTAGFWYYQDSGPEFGTVGVATLLTFSDGSRVQDTLFVADPFYKVNEWAFRDLTQTLHANPGKELIEIGFFPRLQTNRYIDDVSVKVVPLPAAAYLFGSGLLGLIGVARKKRTASGRHTQWLRWEPVVRRS